MKVCIVFEITPNTISYVIGYRYNFKTYILASARKGYESLLTETKTLNINVVAGEISNIYKDIKTKYQKYDKFNVYVLYSPVSSKVTQARRETICLNGKEETSCVTQIDLRNLFNLVDTTASPNVEIIDSYPLEILNEKNARLSLFPVGESARKISGRFVYYTVDQFEFDTLKKIFKVADIKVSKYVLSNVAIAQSLKHLRKTENNSILVQTFENSSVISFVSSGFVLYSSKLKVNIRQLYENIAHKFNITMNKARELVIKHGLDFRKYDFTFNLLNDKSKDNKTIITQNDLNQIIAQFIKDFAVSLNEAANVLLKLLSNYNFSYLPFVFTGEILKINGFDESTLSSIGKDKIMFLRPNNVGALSNDLIPFVSVIDNSDDYEKYLSLFDNNDMGTLNIISRGE